MKPATIFKILAVVALIALILILQLTLDVFSHFSPEKIEGWLERAGAAAPLLYMGVMALAVVVTPIPSLPLDIAAGAFFGPLPGTLYSALGALGGSVISGWVSALVAVAFVALFFLLPRLIERHDFLKLKRYFPHLEQEIRE